MRFDEKKVLVTGASRGIGRAIALQFAGAGAQVAVHYQSNLKAAQATLAELPGTGHILCAGDVADPDAAQRLVAEAVSELRGIDILVNNAGHNITESFEDISEESFERMLNVHVKGTFFMTQTVYKDMKPRGSGRIINITSQLAYKGAPTLTHYSAAKGANATFTRALALECAETGILVNAVAPGVTNTDLLTPLADELLDTLKAAIPLNRFAEVDEIAPAVALLASPEGSFFHGSCISPNGGEVMF